MWQCHAFTPISAVSLTLINSQVTTSQISLCQTRTTQASFLTCRPLTSVQAFFADIYAEARKAKPGAGHKALAQIAKADKLLRHYTMNIDGLAETAGMDAWHVESNPTGMFMFCPSAVCC